MRIAVWYNLPSGGGKRALYHHVAGLVKRGHHLEAWCPPGSGRAYLPLAGLVEEHVVAYNRQPYKARWPWQRLGAYRDWRNRFEAIDEHCNACAEDIQAGGFDVVLAANCIDVAVPPIGRHLKVPSLLYHQEPNRAFYEARPRLPWLALPVEDPKPSRWRQLKKFARDYDFIRSIREEAREERASAEAFDLLLVNSGFSRESVLRAYGLEAKVCYLGVDAGLFQARPGGDKSFVVGLGGIQPHKGVETALEALATIPSAQRPKLVWIGNVTDRAYCAEMAQLAQERSVTLETKHLISDAELVDTLGRAAMLIYTSKLEPFGFAPLEANACGTPVVAVAEGGVRETVRHNVNGLLVADRDPQALGNAVRELLNDPVRAQRLGAAGLEIVRKSWTWDSSVERVEGHLSALATCCRPGKSQSLA